MMCKDKQQQFWPHQQRCLLQLAANSAACSTHYRAVKSGSTGQGRLTGCMPWPSLPASSVVLCLMLCAFACQHMCCTAGCHACCLHIVIKLHSTSPTAVLDSGATDDAAAVSAFLWLHVLSAQLSPAHHPACCCCCWLGKTPPHICSRPTSISSCRTSH